MMKTHGVREAQKFCYYFLRNSQLMIFKSLLTGKHLKQEIRGLNCWCYKGKKWNITIQLRELFGFCWICLPDVKMSITGLHVWTLGPQLAALLGGVVAPGCRGGTLLAGLWGLSGLLPDVWGHKFPPGCTETPLKCEPSLLGWVLSQSLEQ